MLLAAALAIAMTVRAAPASAAPEPGRAAVRLEYTRGPGTEGCPDEDALRTEAIRHLNADPFQADAPLTVTANVERIGTKLVASMQIHDAEGRTLWVDGFSATGTCDALVAAMAFAIAMELESTPGPAPEHDASGTSAAPARPPSAPPANSTRAPAAPRPAPTHGASPSARPRRGAPSPRVPAGGGAPVAERRVQLEGGVSGVAAFGITPGAAGGLSLSIAARWPEWSLGLEARGLAALSQEVDGVPIATSVFTATAVACWRLRLLIACGLTQVGAYRFSTGTSDNFDPRGQPFIALGARIGAELPLSGRLSLRGHAEIAQRLLEATLRRDAVRARVVWNAPPVGMALGLGLVAVF